MEIMNVIWDAGKAVTTADVSEKLTTSWKPTTILTFLKRLTDKGILKAEKSGKTNYYSAIVSREDYKKRQTEEFLNEIHSGSVTSFLAALYGDEKPDKGELEEIKKWFEEV